MASFSTTQINVGIRQEWHTSFNYKRTMKGVIKAKQSCRNQPQEEMLAKTLSKESIFSTYEVSISIES